MAEKPLGNLDLGKKIGPFSIGVWLIVGAGGVGLAYVLNRTVLGGGSGTATAVEPGVGGTPGGFIPAPRPGEEPEEPEEPEEESRILDNEMWAFAATTYLVTQGY